MSPRRHRRIRQASARPTPATASRALTSRRSADRVLIVSVLAVLAMLALVVTTGTSG